MDGIQVGGLVVAGAAFLVSVMSFYFSIKSWQETNRPIVTVRVTTNSSGENITFLDLLVENTGSRPAKNIKLSVDRSKLESALLKGPDQPTRQRIEKCFSNQTSIPMLANGKAITNSFGILSHDDRSDWNRYDTFDVQVHYQDLDGRGYKHTIPLLIINDEGFAGGVWKN